MEKIRVGIVGLGPRACGLMFQNMINIDKIKITAICDLYEDRIKSTSDELFEKAGYRPEFFSTDYRDIINSDIVDVVMILAAWEDHIPIAIMSMKKGKPVGVEVAGAYSIEHCWDLVKTYEETKTPIMMLENCCYGRSEMMAMNMKENGVFGTIVHCNGAYHHDLREEITGGIENRHYRFRNYKNRNCENYPTHELGPIAQLLDINKGNRMISLVSVSSKSVGLHDYIMKKKSDDKKLTDINFCQGDVVTTIIRCARGETITMTLDTSLPGYYSRAFRVQGTDARYDDDTRSLFIDGKSDHGLHLDETWNSLENHRDEYDHPVWKDYLVEGVREGHQGMDWLMLNDFFDRIADGRPMPIDVYDMASWMAITSLTEDSIMLGGAPVAIPDFTNGKWCREYK